MTSHKSTIPKVAYMEELIVLDDRYFAEAAQLL